MKLIQAILLAVSFILLSVSIATATNNNTIKDGTNNTIILDESYTYIPLITFNEGNIKTVRFQIAKDNKLQPRFVDVQFIFESKLLLQRAEYSYSVSGYITTLQKYQVSVLLHGKTKDSPVYKLTNIHTFFDIAKELAHINVR